MNKMTEDQKTSIWTRLGSLLGVSDTLVKLADYEAKDGVIISVDDATGLVQDGVADGEYELKDGRILVIAAGLLDSIKDAPVAAVVDNVPTDAQAQIDALQAQIEELKAMIESMMVSNSELTKVNTELSVKLTDIETSAVDKKVILSNTNPNIKLSAAELAWKRYSNK